MVKATILYLGAIFTREYATGKGIPIETAEFAVHVETQEIERNVTAVPPAPLGSDTNVLL